MINLTLFIATYEQRDSNGLTAENSELKLRLQTMEQQVHLQDGEHLLKTFLKMPIALLYCFFFPYYLCLYPPHLNGKTYYGL